MPKLIKVAKKKKLDVNAKKPRKKKQKKTEQNLEAT